MKRIAVVAAISVVVALIVPAASVQAASSAPWPDATLLSTASEDAPEGFWPAHGGAVAAPTFVAVPGTKYLDYGNGRYRYVPAVIVGDSMWAPAGNVDLTADAPALTVDGDGQLWALWRQYSVDETGERQTDTRTFTASVRSATGEWSSSQIATPGWDEGGAFSLFTNPGTGVSVAWTPRLEGDEYRPMVGRLTTAQGSPTVETWVVAGTELANVTYYQLQDGTIVALGNLTPGGESKTLGAITLGPNSTQWSAPATYSGFFFGSIDFALAIGDVLYVAVSDSVRPIVRFENGAFELELWLSPTGNNRAPILVNVDDNPMAIWFGDLDGSHSNNVWWRLRSGDGTWSSVKSLKESEVQPQFRRAFPNGSGGVQFIWSAARPPLLGVEILYSNFVNNDWTSPVTLTTADMKVETLVDVVPKGQSGGADVIVETNSDVNSYLYLKSFSAGSFQPPTIARPGAPTGVTVIGDVGSLAVSWTAPQTGSAVTGYTATAYTAASGGSAAATCTSTSGTSCVLGGRRATLPDNTTYYVSVVARNAAGDSPSSAPRIQVKTLPTKPVLTKSTATASSVSFAFTRQAGVTYFAVARSGGVVVPARQVTLTQSGAGKVTITGLPPATQVSVTLRASNAPVGYVSSEPVTHTTSVATPAKVTGLAASKIKSGKVTLTWDDVPETGAPVVYRYRWVRKGSTGWSAWAEVSALKGVVSGWVKGTAYSVQILARNSAGDAPTVSADFTAS